MFLANSRHAKTIQVSRQNKKMRHDSLDWSPGVDLQPVWDLGRVVGICGHKDRLASLRLLGLIGHRRRLVVAQNAAKEQSKEQAHMSATFGSLQYQDRTAGVGWLSVVDAAH